MGARTIAARTFLLSTIGVLGALNGCAGSEQARPDGPITKTHLLALSTYSASLGTPIDAYIQNPPTSDAQRIELAFEGTFVKRGGGEVKVSFFQPVTRIEGGVVRWTSFGPFGNPFTPTDPDVGTFRGKVGMRVTLADGNVTMDENPLPIEFEVQPSIIVTELQPTTATCTQPALRLIGLMSYKMKAMPLGFKAKNIEYAFKIPGVVLDKDGAPALETGADGAPLFRMTTVSHEVAGPIDAIDGSEAISLPPVPAGRKQYGVVFSLSAQDEGGRTVRSTFGMTAHNPLEIYPESTYQLSQLYPAEPISGCTSGGQSGREVAYRDDKSETRDRRSTLTLSKSWLKSDENSWSTTNGRTVTTSQTKEDSFSRTHGTQNAFTFERNGSVMEGVSFNWSDTTSAGGKAGGSVSIGIPGVFDLGGNAEGSYDKSWQKGGGTNSSTTSGWSQGTTNTVSDSTTNTTSTATTDSTAVTKSDTLGGSTSKQVGGGQTADEQWSVSSTDTISKDFRGQVVANTYGVFYRQMARYTRKAYVYEYNKCGEFEIVGNVTLQDYVWAPDLALSESCPPFPKTNFPEPQCFLSPCDP